MWYVGSIILIILFVLYMKSKIGNNDHKPYDEPVEPKKDMPKKPDNHDDRRFDYKSRRFSHRRHNSPVRTAGSMMSNSSRSMRDRNFTSYKTPSSKPNGTPRGGGTGGSRGSTSNNNNPGGGRR